MCRNTYFCKLILDLIQSNSKAFDFSMLSFYCITFNTDCKFTTHVEWFSLLWHSICSSRTHLYLYGQSTVSLLGYYPDLFIGIFCVTEWIWRGFWKGTEALSGVSCLLMRGCTIWSGTSCIWSHTSQFAHRRTLTASYCIPVIPVKTLKGVWNDFQQPQFQFLWSYLCKWCHLLW